jgi:hypothetical protein
LPSFLVDVEHNNAGNTYIYVGAINWMDIPRVAKYDTKGSLKWFFRPHQFAKIIPIFTDVSLG